jgi:hypothetical protein
MSADCTKIVHGCGHCDRAKATQRMGAGMTKPMLYSQPFQRMGIDLVGPLTTTKAGFKWILSCIMPRRLHQLRHAHTAPEQ